MARLNGLRYFLTYAQVNDANFNCDTFADALQLLQPSWLEIVQEHHQDDGIHYHAVIVFSSRRQQTMAYFDVGGYHPNIRSIKNGGRDLYYRRHYLRKGDLPAHDTAHKDHDCEYTTEVTARGAVPPYSTVDTAERDDWGSIVEQSVNRHEFLERIKQSYPKDFVLKNDNIEAFASKYYSQPEEYVPKYPRETYTVPAVVDEWVAECFSEVSLPGTFTRTSLFKLTPV